MCGNRVEELESQVKELQASVEGLTDELVECKVRLHELEEVVDEEMGYVPELRSDEDENEEEMRVPEPGEPQDAAEEPNTEAPDESDNTEESESDSDIIVA